MGLCPPEGAFLDNGVRVPPSRLQRVMWNWWKEFWGEWVPAATNGEPFYLVHNGDDIDGVHHSSTTQFTHDLTQQRKLAVEVLGKAVKRAEQYYHIRGTEAHVGKSGTESEAVAKELGAVPNKDGQFARFELWLGLGKGKHLIHFLHHVGTTSSSAHESSAINAELAAEFVEASRWSEKPPSVIVRSHRHRALEVRIPTKHGFATSSVTPAWQLKTPFAWRLAGARLAPPQIGGMVIRCDDDGNLYTKMFVKHIQRDEIEN